MKLDMKKPCVDCPFLVGSSTNKSLGEERIGEIVNDVLNNDLSFTCHKTLPYYDGKPKVEQHCGGAMIMLEKENRPNQIMRMAERIGFYDRTKIDMSANVINPKDYEEYFTKK